MPELPGSPAGEAPRTADVAARYVEHNVPSRCVAAQTCVYRVVVENTGRAAWHRDPAGGDFAGLGISIDGVLVTVGRAIRKVVEPGQRATFAVTVKMPSEPGAHGVSFDMMISGRTWFSQVGTDRLELKVEVVGGERTRTDELAGIAERRNWWFFSPGQGVYRSRSGRPTYPLFADKAKGCRIWDVDGRAFVDLHMGWGCCLLGYADERVQEAVARSLECSGIVSLMHRLEVEVSEKLCARFGFGDEVLFGKNGSDVTTWAVRTARGTTGRNTIVFAGYHGWQDWNAGRLGFERTGIPGGAGEASFAVAVEYGDIAALEEAVAAHAPDLAGIMVEPCATVVDYDDTEQENDGVYLRRAQELARSHGAVFMLDEIMTGFRMPGGSAQQRYGLRPDLTCLGKALANGLPLSALVGRNGVLRPQIGKIFYAPTNKGEAHSFAAANAALDIYADEDVPRTVRTSGELLRTGVSRLCRDTGVNGKLIGPAYRMHFGLFEGDEEERVLWRTLLQQELARHGVISHKGYVLPSRRHDAGAVGAALAAFGEALSVIGAAKERGSAVAWLDCPDVPEGG